MKSRHPSPETNKPNPMKHRHKPSLIKHTLLCAALLFTVCAGVGVAAALPLHSPTAAVAAPSGGDFAGLTLSLLPAVLGTVVTSETAKAALEKLKGHIDTLKGQANEWLSGLKPLEQHQGAEALGYVFNRLKSAHGDLTDMLDRFKSNMTPAFESAMQEGIEALKKDETLLAGVREQILQSGDYVKKADADGRVQTAEQSARENAKTQFAQEAQQALTLTTRRGEVIDALAVVLKTKTDDGRKAAAELCGKMGDEALLADNYKTLITGAGTRLTKAVKLGVTKTETLTELCSTSKAAFSMDDAAFDRQIGTWTDIAKSAAPSGRVPHPFAVNQQERQSTETKTTRRIIC